MYENSDIDTCCAQQKPFYRQLPRFFNIYVADKKAKFAKFINASVDVIEGNDGFKEYVRNGLYKGYADSISNLIDLLEDAHEV